VDLELSAPLPADSCAEPERYRGSLALVRLHGRPLGTVEAPAETAPAELARTVREVLAEEIQHHLLNDGLTVAHHRDEGVIATDGMPACAAARRQALADPPSVTALVATRDRTRELGACLDSLLAQDYPGRLDIVVVDSAPSSDQTEQYMRERFPDGAPARYVRAQRPGLAVAHNAGLPEVTGEITAITDDDVVVDGQWVSAIVEAFRQAPGTACVTGLILPFELETPEQELLEQYGGFSRGFRRRVYSLDQPGDDPLFPFTAGRLGSGANMAFDTAALRGMDGFDAALGAGTPARGGDDLAAFVSVLLAGHRLTYEPSAIVRHRHRRDYAGLRAMAKGYGVGLGAYLTSIVAARPTLLLDMAGRAPRAVSYLLAADSAKNRNKGADYPKELTRVERLGMLRGPAAYLASRRGSA
jgi:glycosyltransferase involved in cell wall biosynthesis